MTGVELSGLVGVQDFDVVVTVFNSFPPKRRNSCQFNIF